MTLSLLIFRVKSRNFGYARARNEINSRDFVNAMYARARNAVISIACKGSSAANVVHTRAQNSVISRGLVVHARAQNAAISRGSTYQFQGFSACKGSKCLNFVRVCACELKVLQFPGSCDFQGFVHARLHILQFPEILCMQELDVLHFPGLCARKGSK